MGLAGMGTFPLKGLAAFSLMSRPVVLGPSASVLPVLVTAISQAPPQPGMSISKVLERWVFTGSVGVVRTVKLGHSRVCLAEGARTGQALPPPSHPALSVAWTRPDWHKAHQSQLSHLCTWLLSSVCQNTGWGLTHL